MGCSIFISVESTNIHLLLLGMFLFCKERNILLIIIVSGTRQLYLIPGTHIMQTLLPCTRVPYQCTQIVWRGYLRLLVGMIPGTLVLGPRALPSGCSRSYCTWYLTGLGPTVRQTPQVLSSAGNRQEYLPGTRYCRSRAQDLGPMEYMIPGTWYDRAHSRARPYGCAKASQCLCRSRAYMSTVNCYYGTTWQLPVGPTLPRQLFFVDLPTTGRVVPIITSYARYYRLRHLVGPYCYGTWSVKKLAKMKTISWQRWHTTIHHDDGKRHKKIEKIDRFSNKFLSSFFYYCYRRSRKVFFMFDSDCGPFVESECKFDCHFLSFFTPSFF